MGEYLFQSATVRAQIKKEAQGAKVLGISPRKLAKVNLYYPLEKTEQQQIVNCLSSLDELIAAEGQKLSVLRAYQKVLLQQLFPAEGENIPSLRFPEFRDAGEWHSGRLGDVFEISSGGTPDRSNKQYWNGTIPWITTSLLNNGHISSAEEYISEHGLRNSSAKTFPCGTVLIAMYGQGKTRGKVSILDCEAATNQACAAIRQNPRLICPWLGGP